MNRPAVGLVLFGVGDLTGGGGAERFFADLFVAYEASRARRAHDLWLICDASASKRLREIGRLPVSPRVIDLSSLGNGRCAQLRALWRMASPEKLRLLHLTLALPRFLPWLWMSRWRRRRAAIALNLNDHEIVTRLRTTPAPRGIDLGWRSYRAFFGARALDGLMVWYQSLSRALTALPVHPPVIHAIRHMFVDTERFRPGAQKENLVVFAGRLVAVKRPELFIDAVAEARRRAPDLVNGWQFVMLGKGPLGAGLQARCAALGLGEVMTLTYEADTSQVFARASVFISTQDHENFTSLAMLEAMACGNAILARNVGQTSEFVRDGVNGRLVDDDTPSALADALLALLRDPEQISRFGRESRRLTLETHCAENLLREFDAFWQAVLAQHER